LAENRKLQVKVKYLQQGTSSEAKDAQITELVNELGKMNSRIDE